MKGVRTHDLTPMVSNHATHFMVDGTIMRGVVRRANAERGKGVEELALHPTTAELSDQTINIGR